ncbi:MAG: IS30 family transposase [Bacilli bacterium]|nr:IS30 family transposase [Bacilli bacterium]
MNYNHLNINERACVYQFIRMGMSIREIAKALNRNPSTISREIKRNSYKTGIHYSHTMYSPTNAQLKYENRRINCHRKLKLNSDFSKYIEEKINLHWSPDQIINRNEVDKPENFPSISTIYRWIHLGYIPKINICKLRRKGKFKRPAETRGRFNIGKTIKKRPKEVYKRNTFGHWEADTVVSGKSDNYTLKSKYCFVTLAERKSRFYLIKHIPDRKEQTVTKAIIELLKDYPNELVKTITCDRGKEFAGWKEIEDKLNTKMYFADPYCAWQKGTNENSNGLLREFYPKHMDLSKTNEKEVQQVLELLNNRPRKCINYRTPHELINEFIYKCCT